MSLLLNHHHLPFSGLMAMVDIPRPRTDVARDDFPLPPIYPVPDASPSWWLRGAELQDTRTTAELPESCDYCVIGAGLTGAAAARRLATLGKNVVVIEARGVAGGASGRNGGHLYEAASDDYTALAARHGDAVAKDLLSFQDDTVQAMIDRVAELDLADRAELSRGDAPADGAPPTVAGGKGAILFLSAAHRDAIRARVAARRAAPGAGAETFKEIGAEEARRRFGAPRAVGAMLTRAGSVWAARLAVGLMKDALARGCNLQCQTLVHRIETPEVGSAAVANAAAAPAAPAIRVVTARGTLRCHKLLLATNAYTAGLLPEFVGRITPCVGQVLVTEPVPTTEGGGDGSAFENRGLIITASLNPTNPDGEYLLQRPADGRLVLGSDAEAEGSWDDSAAAIDPRKSAQLRGYLRKTFAGRVAAARPAATTDGSEEWCGVQGYSVDELPWVGPLPRRPGVYVAAGYTGHGMPHCLSCGEAVADMMVDGGGPAGRRLALEAFSPARDPSLAEETMKLSFGSSLNTTTRKGGN